MKARFEAAVFVSLLTAIASTVVPALHAQSTLSFSQAGKHSDGPVVLTIEVDNVVQYRGNVADPEEFAKDPGPTTAPVITFSQNVQIGDIVAVNGEPAQGIWTAHFPITPFRRNPAPGQPIADLDSGGFVHSVFEIFASDGSYIGTLFNVSIGAHEAVIGGVGAFANVTGVRAGGEILVPSRVASMSEDPSRRRIHGGGRFRNTFHLRLPRCPESDNGDTNCGK
jgi:hypothetical protein